MKVLVAKPEQYAQFHGLKHVQLFASKEWCSCYDERLIRFFILDDNNNPIGGFVGFEGGKGKLKTLITPPFAPHIGLFVEENKNSPVKVNSFRKQIIETIGAYLIESEYRYYKLDFSTNWRDMQPMIWKKIHTSVRYTYRIDLSQTATEISANLDGSKRNKINKAEKEGLIVSHLANPELAIKMLEDSFESNSLFLHPHILKNVLQFTSRQGQGIWTSVSNETGPIAVNICVLDGATSYNLLSAINRVSKQSHGGTFCLYHSILFSKEQGLRIFDFEGSGVPEIEEYFRSFGGELVSYFSVTGGKWLWPWFMKFWQKKRSA